MLTVMITVAMVFGALAVISFAAEPAFASSSGTFTLNPTVFGVTAATTVVVNGGTFGSGATVTFYASSTNHFTGTSTPLGQVTLSPGETSMSNTVVSFTTSGLTAGDTYYTAASDDSGLTFAGGPQITIGTITPVISVSPSSAKAGGSVTLTATTGFDSGSNIAVYLNYAGGPVLLSSVSETDLAAGVTLTVPTNEPGGAYSIVAQESSSSSTNYGITAAASLTILPAVSVSPASISGATTSTFTLVGHGFPASDTFSASTSLNPKSSITVAGTQVLNPQFTTDTTGSFSVTTTGLSASIGTYGTATINMEDSSSTSFNSVGTILISVPNPASLGFSFTVTYTSGSIINVGDSVAIEVWNFPSAQSVNFYLGSVSVGSLTTDANGAGTLSTVIPAMAGGSYTPTAVASSSHLIATVTAITISPYFQALDPTGATLLASGTSSGEYVPSAGVITIQAYGLNPASNGYDLYDSIVAPSSGSAGVYAMSLVTKVSVGSETSNLLAPATNGTLIFTYSPGYATLASPPTTGFLGALSFNVPAVVAYTGYSYSFAYYAIGSISFTHPTSLQILASGATGSSLAVSGLIPYTASLYPGVVNTYNAFIGSTELSLTFTNHNSVVVTGTTFDSGDSAITYTVPTATGLLNLSIVYNGQSISTAPGVEQIVISSTGSSASSGTLVLVATTTGYDVVGYGYDQAVSPITLYYVGSSGVSSGASETLTNGAFVDTSVLATTPAVAAGTYAVFTEAVSSATTYFVYSSYTVVTNITLSEYNGYVGDTVTLGATGLLGNQLYTIYFDNLEVGTLGTNAAGSVSGKIFAVPIVQPGMYDVNLTLLSGPSANNTTAPSTATVVASAGFEVKAVTTVTLSTDAPVAFPGQIVTFSWMPATAPSHPAGYNGQYGPVSVTVLLNGTAYTTEPAAFAYSTGGVTYLNGSFLMPNAAVGSYYFVTFSWTQVVYPASTASVPTVHSYTQTAGAYIQLVSGNGALLTGISSAQIAQITTDVSNAVTTSMKVPLSELNASVVAINGLVVKIDTAFGNMTSTLSAINATVKTIESGQVLVQTDLGSISTSLASLNASIAAFNGNVATISTTLGNIQTNLSSIGTKVTSNSNGIATITTDFGTLSGTVTSMNGNIGTISTSLGTLNANVTKISSPISSLEIFLIVIVILVLITLVLSFLAINSVNRVSKKIEEQKKQ
jgi:hypothetical protein